MNTNIIKLPFLSVFQTDLDNNNDPTIYIWILYFLALHHSCGPYSSNSPFPDPERSLTLINRAIEHTPTLPELYMGKAKVCL